MTILNDEQELAAEGIADFIDGKLDIPYFTLTGAPGTGKALADSELVLTPTGFVENKTLSVGDFVIGANGKKTKILGVYPQGIRDMYKVSFQDDTSNNCDLEHIWRVRSVHNKVWNNKTTEDLLNIKLFSTHYDKRYDTVQKKYNYAVSLPLPVEYDKIDKLPLDPYTLGVLLGDGGFSTATLKLSLNHKFDTLKLKLLDGIILKPSIIKKNHTEYNLVDSYGKCNSPNRLTTIIKNLDLWQCKSVEKFIPEIYLKASITDRKALLQGLLDTDGSIISGSIDGNEYSTSSLQLKIDVHELLGSLGIYHRITSRIPTYTYKKEKKKGQKSFRIYINFNKKRKNIISIEKIGKEAATCIKVAAKDSLYVIENFTVTHNTFMLREALYRVNKHMMDRSAAAVAHAAKNVLNDSLGGSMPCYTVAQWLGMKMTYSDTGEVQFKPNKKAIARMRGYGLNILDEASMIDDYLYDEIMNIVTAYNIKLIVIGDVYQLPPVGQDHDSKFFDNINARLTIPMRFSGPISNIATVYRTAIKEINDGYIGNISALNERTSRADDWDTTEETGYRFKNDIHELVEQVAEETKNHPLDLNYSRMLAYKNNTVNLLNKNVRLYIYGKHSQQFEHNEIVISRGGFTKDRTPVIHNGKLLRVKDAIPIMGPYNVPCLSLQFKDFVPYDNVAIPVVEYTDEAEAIYNETKTKLFEYARRDPKQWVHYYKFIDSFAYFDYAYSVNVYRAQGQTLRNVYVLEGEIMGVKPLTLKQKYQALYVAMTRATKNLYIYNKNY